MYNSKIIVQAVFFLFIFNLLYLLGKTGFFCFSIFHRLNKSLRF